MPKISKTQARSSHLLYKNVLHPIALPLQPKNIIVLSSLVFTHWVKGKGVEVFLAGKIIRKARHVVMKLPAKYPYKDIYEKCLSWEMVPNIPVLASLFFYEVFLQYQYSASQELFVKFMAMWYRKCYNIENIYNILRQLEVNEGV